MPFLSKWGIETKNLLCSKGTNLAVVPMVTIKTSLLNVRSIRPMVQNERLQIILYIECITRFVYTCYKGNLLTMDSNLIENGILQLCWYWNL